MARVLFILKYRDCDYGSEPCYGDGLSSGLFNSARLVSEMLHTCGIESKVVQVVDNNDIDREVYAYRPTHVIIEGLWVVPEKFYELMPLHRHVEWIVRIHSEIPFLAMEGIAIDWIVKYQTMGVTVACNSPRARRDLLHGVDIVRQVLLPNYYPVKPAWWKHIDGAGGILRIGCFGAIRPLKNQLTQAIAAIEYANTIGKQLHFYMSHRDSEQGGETVLKNIRALFKWSGRHRLVLREWLPHEDFLGLLDLMHAVMQVSFTETFCIVAADAVGAGVPVVVSPEVRWASSPAKAEPTDVDSIVAALSRVTHPVTREMATFFNRRGLERYGRWSKALWLGYLKGERSQLPEAA